jgi:hypothetical protein
MLPSQNGKGQKQTLKMVAGADSFLEILAEGEGEIDVILSQSLLLLELILLL